MIRRLGRRPFPDAPMLPRDFRADEALREQQRRLANFAATVRSISHRTVEDCADLEAYRALFDARLAALARAHAALARSDGQGADLGELVGDALLAHGPGARGWTLEGHDVRLPESAVEILALIFGELAAWSSVAGALSADGTGLDVSWSRLQSDPARIRLEWRDLVARPAPLPAFLTGLVDEGLPFQARAQGRLSLTDRELVFAFLFPPPTTLR